ncbi:MAG TPA: SigB/SigF/SigG family RNA polymerase sigma factor [Methylomirabilota bacterium]|jgi:RNA polymerase sigma-B factor
MSTGRKSQLATARFGQRPGEPACRAHAAPDPVGREQSEKSLFERYRSHHDLRARDELIRRFLPLAQRLARRYDGGDEPLEDLVQVAGMALVKAVDRFDTERGTPFVGYAVPTITGELKRHFRDCSWALHVPRGMQERILHISKAAARLSGEHGRSPTAEQIAAATGLSSEAVLEGLEAARAYNHLSLDEPVPSKDVGVATYADMAGEVDPHFEIIEERLGLQRGFLALPQRERLILYLRFSDGLTQAEIGRRMGISQMHVSRLLRRALGRLDTVVRRGLPG